MSEPDDELEFQALQRELDDAFATTRPRRGFDDELWTRMQARRPHASRLAAALAAFVNGLRMVPPVPAAVVAAILVVVVGIGLLGVHLPQGSNGAAGSQTAGDQFGRPNVAAPGGFGRVPSPQLSPAPRTVPGATQVPTQGSFSPDYTGPLAVTWTGRLETSANAAPVYRYTEPSTDAADQFAAALGAVLNGRPAGFLGVYDASDYTLMVRGTSQVTPQGPAYFILSMPNLPALVTAGGPAQVAIDFLDEHHLVPQWPYTVDVQPGSAGLTSVTFQRQFDAGANGPAYLVDADGRRYGLEVDLDGARPVTASGPLPVAMQTAVYPIIGADAAVRAALATSTATAGGPTPVPTLTLDHAELVYVLVPDGVQSFYEPAYLFSGTLVYKGVTHKENLLIPAVDPSQRS